MWKKGFKEWVKARFVYEMKELFKDEQEFQQLDEMDEGRKVEVDRGQQNQAILALQQDPYQYILWILLFLLILFYTLYQFYYNN